MVSVNTALWHSLIFGAIVLLCRLLPFILLRNTSAEEDHTADAPPHKSRTQAFLRFVEAAVPAVAMTVLAVNALAAPVRSALAAQDPQAAELIPLAVAAVFTAALHLWKRNPLVSIFGGTAAYMLLGLI